jgi:hypothetical protein
MSDIEWSVTSKSVGYEVICQGPLGLDGNVEITADFRGAETLYKTEVEIQQGLAIVHRHTYWNSFPTFNAARKAAETYVTTTVHQITERAAAIASEKDTTNHV